MSKFTTALKLANLERAAADQRLAHLAYRLLSLSGRLQTRLQSVRR